MLFVSMFMLSMLFVQVEFPAVPDHGCKPVAKGRFQLIQELLRGYTSPRKQTSIEEGKKQLEL